MLRERAAVLLLGSVLVGGMAYGQDYPYRPIRILTAAAGGGSDFMSRLISQGITGPLGQPVIVDNRVALVSVEIVSKALPDGYTLYVGGNNTWIAPLLRPLPYSIDDLAPISLLTKEILLLAVHPSVPASSVQELIALAKAKPGALNYGSTAPGGSTHLAMELFKSMTGTNIVRVSYKGNVQQISSVLSDETQLTMLDIGALLPQAKAGKLKALAVTSAEPTVLAPGVPTVASAGLPGYEMVGMTCVWATAKTPKPVIDKLNREIVRVWNMPEVKEKILSTGSDPVGNSPEQFAALIKSDVAKMGKLIKDAGIKAE